MENRNLILQMKEITKEFPGVKALDKVSLKVSEGSIHAICGENGAGKSTLMNVLSGVYPYGSYDGQIFFRGKEVHFRSIKESEQIGIAIIHQELTLIPELSVTENIFLGNEIIRRGLIDWGEQKRRSIELLEKVGLSIDPDTLIKNLGVGQQQLVEIAKALSKNVSLLILDEPTSALNEDDSENLLELMLGLKNNGITCIMISHKLNEIAKISDAVTVIRDGCTVESYPVQAGHVDEDKIIRAMVGRPIANRYPPHEAHLGEVLFEVSGWTVEDPNIPGRMLCKSSSFYIREGEIVGFAGLMGSGRTELMRSLFGKSYGIFRSGSIRIRGKEAILNSVEEAISSGIAYVPEDRKQLGLNLLDSIRKTTVSANLKKILSGWLLDPDKELQAAQQYCKELSIKTSGPDAGVATLSGGNQQKVVLSKWLFTEPLLLILDEPTRGIDVGAKYEIYKLIHELARQGKAIIMVSSELPELLGVTDRIYTICEGSVTGEVMTGETDQESLMKLMTKTSVS